MGVIEETINSYFFTNERIGKTIERSKQRQFNFYNQTMITHSGFRDEEPATIAFNVENEVVNHVAAQEMAEQHIQLLEFKQHHIKRFFNTLDTSSKNYYYERYKHDLPVLNDRLDKLILEEVKEIEEAATHYFKLEEDVIYITKERETTKEKLEDFSKMLEILGV